MKNPIYKYVPIGDILSLSQYGISIDMNENANGYKIYRMNEISDMFCNRTVDKFADIDKETAKKFTLKQDDVLFNRTNSQVFVGRTGIFKSFSDEPLIFASYLVRLRPDKNLILPEYLTVFLNTKYGIMDVKRRARISINQSNVSAEEVKKVDIPLLSLTFQKSIKTFLDDSFKLLLSTEMLYSQAEQILLSELGLLNWQPKQRLSFVKNYSDAQSAERIDAEYFQPMYDEILKQIKLTKNGCEGIVREVPRGLRNSKPPET